MSRKIITHLEEFSEQNTFIRLLNRVNELKRLISVVQNLRSLHINLINMLSKNDVNFYELIIDEYQLFSIYYRSLFQASKWEGSCFAHIDPTAYN
ncbi:hypothetical protein Lbru_0473 [Legionella brunensis]|uniref:Uncharacterized protein n=1 Tax=Legionella brunensis TaxID=29422 RepID=A0A0W0STC8_9GAMM|nr:hypothetical protein Lbru_0473 [Legionella brunensis]